jgi:hypothetical protein
MSFAARPAVSLIFWLTAMVLVSQAYGCLYMSNGSAEDVAFQSEPADAQVTVNGVQHGTTPIVVNLSRCEAYAVTIAKPGYTPVGVRLGPTISGPDTLLAFLDEAMVLPGLVDKWNCSAGTLRPNPIIVGLLPVPVPAAPGAPVRPTTTTPIP